METNKIYCKNCVELMGEMPSDSIDLVITSPPYGNMRKYNGYDFNFQDIAKGLYKVIKPGGVIVWIVGDQTINGNESGDSFRQALYFQSLGLNLWDTMIFQKSGFNFPATNRYHQSFDYMFILSKGKPKTFNPIKDRKNKYIQKPHGRHRGKSETDYKDLSKIIKAKYTEEYGMRYNIWYYIVGGNKNVAKDKIAHQHPAIFPENLAQDHILSWSNEGDIIFDPMAGSGTTPCIAKKLNRNYIACDCSPDYIEIINERLKLFSPNRIEEKEA